MANISNVNEGHITPLFTIAILNQTPTNPET